MSEQPPKGKGWSDAPGGPQEQAGPNSIAHKSELDSIKKLRAQIPTLIKQLQEKDRGRARSFLPYVMIRAVVGDHGDRPINVAFWESPDIWTAPGEPAVSPAVPPDHGGTLTVGVPHTIYAHVWNLGRAPIAGVQVEFYWFDPSIAINDANKHVIGTTRVDLGPRSSQTCHKLVKCPKAWVPTMANVSGHECLIVRVSAIGDPIGTTNPWHPWANRHVGQRNVHVVPASQFKIDLTKLFASLEKSRQIDTRVQLVQVGAQAEITLKTLAPHVQADPAVQTHVLAELRADGSLFLPATLAATPGGSAAAKLTPATAPIIAATPALAVPRVDTASLFTVAAPSKAGAIAATRAPQEVVATGADLSHLINHATLLTPEVSKQITQLPPPTRNHAQVLRLISFQGDQMIGGYTIIVTG